MKKNLVSNKESSFSSHSFSESDSSDSSQGVKSKFVISPTILFDKAGNRVEKIRERVRENKESDHDRIKSLIYGVMDENEDHQIVENVELVFEMKKLDPMMVFDRSKYVDAMHYWMRKKFCITNVCKNETIGVNHINIWYDRQRKFDISFHNFLSFLLYKNSCLPYQLIERRDEESTLIKQTESNAKANGDTKDEQWNSIIVLYWLTLISESKKEKDNNKLNVWALFIEEFVQFLKKIDPKEEFKYNLEQISHMIDDMSEKKMLGRERIGRLITLRPKTLDEK
jgi:hypothetical protein